MKSKTLSIVIPSYNMQEYLARCLESLLPAIKDLDVLVVNDGSDDDTLKIAKEWQEKYPQSIKAIDKPNGGHGSTINVGLKAAKGKYFRVLDADDWLNQDLITEYIKTLQNSDEDLVITNYSYIYKDKKELVDVANSLNDICKIQAINDVELSPNDFISMISIHSCTVKTKALKKVWGKGLLEKTFYEDQEFVSKVILATESVEVCALDVYQYFLARDGQSMSRDKLFKHRKDHEKVLLRLAEISQTCKNLNKQEILQKRVREMYKTHYWIYFYHPGLSKIEKTEFKEFKKQILKFDPRIAKNVKLGFKLRLWIGRKKSH